MRQKRRRSDSIRNHALVDHATVNEDPLCSRVCRKRIVSKNHIKKPSIDPNVFLRK